MQKLLWAGLLLGVNSAIAQNANINLNMVAFDLKKNSTINASGKDNNHLAGVTDDVTPFEKYSTAGKNVHIVDTAFYIPQLNRYRRVWIYLPEGYEITKKKYEVIYLQDGQNVFDEATSFAGEWGVDETLDTMDKSYRSSIVVAVDNGGTLRLNEYSPYDTVLVDNNKNNFTVKGEGDLYADFMARTLKPYIDKHYRTKKYYKHTYIGGSSMGALISFYTLLKYPRVFGGGAIFSPSFWIAPQLKNIIAERGKKVKGKIYFYAGKLESDHMITDMLAVFDQLNKVSKAKMTTVIRAERKHNEAAWREEFPQFYKWLMK